MKEVDHRTAGHVDHGKTSLIKAITGIDCDRLKEEKERGLTIELGFASMTLPSGERVGVVDVPGHVRFIRHMLSGASGIDLVLLVIAADEGVMPQTENLQCLFRSCELLGIKNEGWSPSPRRTSWMTVSSTSPWATCGISSPAHSCTMHPSSRRAPPPEKASTTCLPSWMPDRPRSRAAGDRHTGTARGPGLHHQGFRHRGDRRP